MHNASRTCNLQGPLPHDRGLCLALLAAEATPTAAFAYPDEDSGQEVAQAAVVDEDGATAAPQLDFQRAREAARMLLSRQRGSSPLFGAYAALEAAVSSLLLVAL